MSCASCDDTGCPCWRARDWQSMEDGCDRTGCEECGQNGCDKGGLVTDQRIVIPKTDLDQVVREIAREEVASLCGLVLRRLQDVGVPAPGRAGNFLAISAEGLSEIFGEALADFRRHRRRARRKQHLT